MKKANKDPIDPDRIRSLPSEGFSWIDRRFVREGFIKPLPKEAVLLYLFLAAVSDAKGISFYGEATLQKLLKISDYELTEARSILIDRDLILYRRPLYQVLPLPTQVKRSVSATAISTAPPSDEVAPPEEDLITNNG